VPEGATPARQPLTGQVDAVVVGAGFGGLYMLHRLRELGLSVQGFEAADGVGGTWWWNRYPGARCDLPSLYYAYTWSEDLSREWRWSERYAAQPEILAYANHVADRFDLRGLIAFGTRVLTADFDETTALWTLETDRGDRVTARWCVMATGCLSAPRAPAFPGEETFRGPRLHTGLWPHEPVTFTGLRVGVIGTGSSGIQSIPRIAKTARRVTVFQRTPNFSLPAQNGPLGDAEIADYWARRPKYLKMLKAGLPGVAAHAEGAPVPPVDEQRRVYEEMWAVGGPILVASFPNLLTDETVNAAASDFVREKIAQAVKDPQVAARLSPHDHPIGTKRICVDTDYYQTFNRPNVELVDIRAAPIEAITPDGLRTTELEYALDALVYATGFDAVSGALLAMNVRGAGGVTLREAWADGPHAYLGLAVAGFPNLFVLAGPGSPSVLSNMMVSLQEHVDWVTGCIADMRAGGYSRIAAEPAAQADWVAHVKDLADRSLFPRANSWYVGANIPGKPRVFTAYIGGGYRQRCEEVAANGYEGFALA
jgi:cyclohexanone monooxygenase